MAGFTSMDDLVNQITTNGKFFRADWNKNHATAGTVIAGSWQCLAGGAGNPPANTALGGTTLIPITMYDFLSTAGGIQHGGAVDAAYAGYKQLLNASAFSAAATTMVPAGSAASASRPRSLRRVAGSAQCPDARKSAGRFRIPG